MITDAVLQFLAAFFGTIAFSVLFSVPKEHYPLCGVIGGTGWLICWALIHVLHVGVVDYNGVTDHKVEIGSDEAIVEASVSGADHNAVVTLIINDQGSLSSITVNVERSMGELMLNAALNTLMGMGTVFIILILISLLIGCFKFIPQIQEKFSKKNKQPAAAPAAAPVVAAPVEEEEETSDEELIAVIAAAIAASEGSTSTDGFVVRSIRRRSGSWKNA